MATVKMYDQLQSEYNRTQSDLKEVDRSLRKLSGQNRQVGLVERKRRLSESNRSYRNGGNDYRNHKNDLSDSEQPSANKRRPTLLSTIAQVSGPDMVMPKKEALPEGEEALTRANEDQSVRRKPDGRGLARNRRMLGIIMGTLQKFQSEESRRKETTSKKEKIDRKVEKAAEEEKQVVRQQRDDLFRNRKNKQLELKKIELKIERVKIHQDWEKSMQRLGDFIQTKTKPSIYYCPAKHTPGTERKLKESRDKFKFMLAERKAKVQKELVELDERYKTGVKKEEDEENVFVADSSQVRPKASNGIQDESDEGELKDEKEDEEERIEERQKSSQADEPTTQVDCKKGDCESDDSQVKLEPSSTPRTSDDKSNSMQCKEEGEEEGELEEKEFEPIYEE